ncbi:MAG: metallophosphoesterase [Clostridia bacterium]|nr:metallophosphoesterase [Clostridia bacterium]
MDLIRTKVVAGAERPFTLVHASDTHLTLADGRDGERKVKLALKRKNVFGDAEGMIREISRLSKELSAPIVYTGDLIDFVSRKNLEYAKKFADENDVFFTAGNHEFSLYVGEAFEDEAYRNKSLARVQRCFKNDIRFASRVMNGVNLIGIDDSYYLFDKAQLDALKKEISRGLPIILFMHNALYEEKLFGEIRSDAPYLACPPKAALEGCSEYRIRQQTPDAITIEMTEYIKRQPLIKAIFTGHLHWDWDGMLTPSIPQYVTGKETVRIIEVS